METNRWYLPSIRYSFGHSRSVPSRGRCSGGFRKLFADEPEVAAFLTDLPTAWDETLLLDGHPDTHAVWARRRGGTWYVGGINGLTGPLTFSDWISRLTDVAAERNTTALSGNTQYKVVATDGPIQTILFEGEPYLGRPTEVFAYMGVPLVRDQPVPGMVCVHGGGGTAFRKWVEMWVERGYAALAMDLGGRDDSGNRLPNGGPEQDHDAKFSTTAEWHDMWTYHAVAAVMRANSILSAHPAVDSRHVGITGISWGGYVTCIAAAVDPRFACAIPVYGCGFLQHNSADDWMRIFAGMTTAQRQAWHHNWDPAVYLRQVKVPVLFVSGTNDFAYPLDILEASCALPVGTVTRCIRVDMPHGHEPGWAPDEIRIFADHHLRSGTPLPAIGACEHGDGFLKAPFTPVCPVEKGHLHYTKCGGNWKHRKWHSIPAELKHDTVMAALPEGATACFLAIEDTRGAYVSSPCLQTTRVSPVSCAK